MSMLKPRPEYQRQFVLASLSLSLMVQQLWKLESFYIIIILIIATVYFRYLSKAQLSSALGKSLKRIG